ncbi:MbtH family NRPS accessory protein [Micromonospora sp. C31]|uniref:thioesterase domain-containing protein n=1 Tax=Micromonospora sp. C31 TaxID=2824876 RepID=UPI001B38C3E4|nr:thioesterase domain-containing protein [Micromonospora sp. C31]MBQ1075645.1 MbtH family NRPS accessory protein [Micromonospora sp. C31]
MFEDDDDRRYAVVRNDDGHYSLWPQDRTPPSGWTPTGVTGAKAECLAHVAEVWVDMRPRRLRELRSSTSVARHAAVPHRPRSTSAWLVGRMARPEAPVRLYCFPHSGGSAGEYVRLLDVLPDVEVWGIQLPGRGGHLERAPLTAMSELVTTLLAETEFTGRFAFLGHSLGALVAYETAKALRERGREQPEQLILSACTPPHHVVTRAPLHLLPDTELLTEIERQYGGLPAAIRDEPDLLELVLPYHRADFQIFETYRGTLGEALDQAFSVVGGADDAIPVELLAEWCRHTTGPFQMHRLPGGHFYWREAAVRDQFLRIVADSLRATARPAVQPAGR